MQEDNLNPVYCLYFLHKKTPQILLCEAFYNFYFNSNPFLTDLTISAAVRP